jgi:hypothetical protein
MVGEHCMEEYVLFQWTIDEVALHAAAAGLASIYRYHYHHMHGSSFIVAVLC